MKFDELDKRMREFEQLDSARMPPGIYLVSRIDGRSFTKLTKETLQLEAPFDIRFRDAMAHTVQHLMTCGFRPMYGYTQSDEISLLFHKDDSTFQRKLRKWNSVLAGEASAAFSLAMGAHAAFDSRIIPLPSPELVVEYFRWRQEDAVRNALNAHCYWAERRAGKTASAATSALIGMSVAQKNELLFTAGINFNEVPLWQRRGIGCYWQETVRDGVDPRTGITSEAVRRTLVLDVELPMKRDYEAFLHQSILTIAGPQT